jgi:hypothetical protein
MNPDDMTVEQLDAAIDALDAEIAAIRERKRALAAARATKLAAEHLAAKTRHLKPHERAALGLPANQVASPGPVAVGAAAKKGA